MDVTAAFQLACNSGAATVDVPYGGYQLSGTITLYPGQAIIGAGRNSNGGTVIYAGPTQNTPVFKFSSGGGEIRSLSILGSATVSLTGQQLIYVNNTNYASVRDVYMNGGYNAILVDGTSFYTSIFDCVFDAQYNAQLVVNSVTAAGCDLMVKGCRFVGMPSTGFACVSTFGLGSLQMADCAFTINLVSAASLYLDMPAPLFGGAIFTNCVFENAGSATGPAVYVKGASATPWNTLHFVGGIITGGTAIGMRVDFVKGLTVTGTTLSSVNANGSMFFGASAQASDVRLVGCGFEGNSGTPPIQCGLNAVISMDIIGPRWSGVAAFVNFAQTTAASIPYLNVFGGSVGTASPRLVLPTPANVAGTQLTDSVWNTYTPTVSAVTGAINSYSSTGSYQKIGKVMHFRVSVAIVDNGTGSGAVNISLPRNAGETSICIGKGAQISGKSLLGAVVSPTNTLRVNNYDGSYPAVTGEVLVLSGTYQTD